MRDAAIIALMYASGLRRGEIATLQLEDFKRERSELHVWGKGNKERVVYTTGGELAALSDWLVIRGEKPGVLFTRIRKGGWLTHQGMSDSSVYKMLQKRAGEAGIRELLTPHDLRRSFATDLFRARVPAPTVQRMMGHADISTTARYDMSGAEAEREASGELYVPYTRRYASWSGG